MEKSIVIYDAEYWADKGSLKRGWNGLNDHPPYLIQFSAIKVKLTKKLPQVEKCNIFMKPLDRLGQVIPLTKYFSQLTKITPSILNQQAVSIPQAFASIKTFIGDNLCFSYGGDEQTIALSCYLWQQENPLNPKNCRDVRQVLYKAGMTEKDIHANSSGSLAAFFGLNFSGHIHDATADSLSILLTFRHFLDQNKMTLHDLT